MLGGSNGYLGIDNLSIGVSKQGMNDYRIQLRADLLTRVRRELDNRTDLEAALKKGWQGQSCKNYLINLRNDVEKIETDLEAEYNDLENRLSELESNYFKQDNEMVEVEGGK